MLKQGRIEPPWTLPFAIFCLLSSLATGPSTLCNSLALTLRRLVLKGHSREPVVTSDTDDRS
jgi:hypothetical protein